RYLIGVVEWIGYDWIPALTEQWGMSYVIFVPAIGGLLVGLLIYLFAREAKGHGVPEVMEAVALRGGRIRPVVAVVKSLASAICIGSGGAVGREGPIVQIGSAIGSTIGQALKLSDDRVSNLVACGAAGGIAATFNAPIAGVIFALEVILGGRFSVRYFSSVVVSSVTASVVGRIVFGDIPAFAIPFEYGINNLWEFLLYPVLGVLAAVVGVVFVRLLYASEDFFDSFKRVPEWVKPAIGGVLLGILALIYPLAMNVIQWHRMPQIFNVGYETIEMILENQATLLSVVLALLVLKLIATSLTVGSGGSGGIFAPSLFMGAMLGAAFALAINSLFPEADLSSGAYALVGMAAVFSASAHAPITAILILFELTGDYRIILPLMLTVVVSTVLAQRMLKGQSIYTLKLTRRDIHLERGRDVDILQNVVVKEVMTRHPQTVNVDMSLSRLTEMFAHIHHNNFMVLDQQGKLWGVVTIGDMEEALEQSEQDTITVEKIGTTWPHLKAAFPDDTIGESLAQMSVRGLGCMPVVSHDDPYHPLGIIRRQDIIQAYNLALTRRVGIQHRAKQMETLHTEGTKFVEIFLNQNDIAMGQTIQDISPKFPKDCIIISIRRDGRL
ncbi:MAG: chloride channel protein, partial [Oceanicoccus sp.]|uniref:chloride channel protein n=1 Tax=Oceanicoccus sp. TaxID=2691044 RepID=UPI00260E0500